MASGQWLVAGALGIMSTRYSCHICVDTQHYLSYSGISKVELPMPSSPRFPSPPALSRAFDRVARGEWAELAFMAKAASLGLVACRPPGNSRPFDFLVYVPGVHAVRVQVKSAWSKNERAGGACSGVRWRIVAPGVRQT